MSDVFRAKLELIHNIESVLNIHFEGNNEREADLFINNHYMAYKTDNEYAFKDMYEFTEDGW